VFRWRAIEDGAVGCRENSTVAGTYKYMLLRPVKYWAGGVGAKSAERNKGALRWMQKETRMLVIRIRDDFHPATGMSATCATTLTG